MIKLPIVRAAKADQPQIERCVREAYQHYVERIGNKPGPMLDDYAAIIADHSIWVIREDDIVAGALVLIAKPDYLLLDNVAVLPEYQGLGYGRRLIKFAEIEARQRGYSDIALYTHELMHENIALYTGIGYTEFERKEERGFQRVYMRKALN